MRACAVIRARTLLNKISIDRSVAGVVLRRMYYLSSTGFVRSFVSRSELHVVFISSTLQIKRRQTTTEGGEGKKIESVEFFFSYVRILGHIVRTKVIEYRFCGVCRQAKPSKHEKEK